MFCVFEQRRGDECAVAQRERSFQKKLPKIASRRISVPDLSAQIRMMRSQQEKSQSFWPFVSNKTKRFGKAKTSVQLAHSLGLGAPTVRRDVRAGDDARVPRPRREGGAAQAEVRAQGVGGLGDARAAHDARRSAKSQYADIFQSNGNTPGARRGASPAGAPATPAGGSYAATEMARRARRTPPSRKRLARTPETPESARVASRANGAHASGGRNLLDAALAASPPRETPGSRIRAAAAVALTLDSKYRARVMGESAVTPAEASPGARRGTDREGGDDGDDGGSPLGPESSLGGRDCAARLVALAGVAAPVSPRRAQGSRRRVSRARARRRRPELATPEAARGDAAPPGSSARPSTGRNLARFLKRRQAARGSRRQSARRRRPTVPPERRVARRSSKRRTREKRRTRRTSIRRGRSTRRTSRRLHRSARDAEARASAPRAPLAPLAAETLAFRPEEKEKEESLGAFIERATAEAEAEAEAASAALAFSGYSERNDISETSPDPPFFVRDDDDDAYPPTPAESPSPLRSANAETHAAWIKQGYGSIRASAAAAAPLRGG